MKDKKEIEQLARECGTSSQILSDFPHHKESVQYGFIKGYELAQQSQSASIQQAVELALKMASEEAKVSLLVGECKKECEVAAELTSRVNKQSILSLLPKVLEQLNVSDGWVSVDVLPNKNDLGFYLCYLIEVNDLGISKYQDLVWFNGLNFDNTSVSHYQPLPSPPQLK